MTFPPNTQINGTPLLVAHTQTDSVTAAWTSATTQNTALQLNVINWATVSVTLNQGSTITGGTVIFEVSDSLAGTNWYPLSMASTGLAASVVSYNLVASTNIAFQMNVAGFTLFRVRLSSAIQGTATVNVGIVGNSSSAEYAVSASATIVGPVDSSGNIKIAQPQQSLAGAGSTGAAPTGGTSITTATAANTGTYLVQFAGGFGATAESTALDNIGLKIGATFFTAIPLANLANTMSQPYTIYLKLNATQQVSVYVINNASAGSIYKGYISITQVE